MYMKLKFFLIFVLSSCCLLQAPFNAQEAEAFLATRWTVFAVQEAYQETIGVSKAIGQQEQCSAVEIGLEKTEEPVGMQPTLDLIVDEIVRKNSGDAFKKKKKRRRKKRVAKFACDDDNIYLAEQIALVQAEKEAAIVAGSAGSKSLQQQLEEKALMSFEVAYKKSYMRNVRNLRRQGYSIEAIKNAPMKIEIQASVGDSKQ